jgi:hypothetical protein
MAIGPTFSGQSCRMDEQVIDPCENHDRPSTRTHHMVLQEIATSVQWNAKHDQKQTVSARFVRKSEWWLVHRH